jgi:hypothetical protein
LEIIRDCAPLLINRPAVLHTVLSFVEFDEPDVVVMSLLALHELVGNKIHHYAHVLSFVSGLIADVSVVLDQLLIHLPNYPNLYSIVSMLATIDNSPDRAIEPLRAAFSDPKSFADSYSHVWPLLLSARVNPDSQQILIDFVISIVPDFEQDYMKYVAFLTVLTAYTYLDLPFYLSRRLENTSEEMTYHKFMNLIWMTLLHLKSSQGHSQALLRLFRNSPFGLLGSIAAYFPPTAFEVRNVLLLLWSRRLYRLITNYG